ncbi:hypothetical protein M2165_001809 [Variovorax sp. TBS-050B]|nr:hypothetical protein [Variovorax sp. TBS-050B]
MNRFAMPKGARLVGHDGHDARAERLVLEQVAEQPHEGHGGAHLLAGRGGGELCIGRDVGLGHHLAGGLAARHGAAERFAALAQVAHLGAVLGGAVEVHRDGLRIAQRQAEAVAEFEQVDLAHLLVRMRGHLALRGAAHAVALLGVGEDHGGPALVRGRRGIGGMDLHKVVAAALEAVDLLVGHAFGEACELGVLAEEVVAVEAPVLGREGLHLAVHRVGEHACQRAAHVLCEQAVPVAAPDQLDDVPAGAGEQLLELVDDAAVAAHRPVEPLQVAVDHPHEVVELLARGQGQCAHRFGLVHLAVAEHAPHLAPSAVEQMAVREIAHEARVVDRADRTDAHRAGRELPEVRHQVGMRIAAQAACAAAGGEGGRGEFLAVVLQVLFTEAAFEEGARIDARGAVRLEEYEVAPMRGAARMEEVVEAGLEQVGRARIARDVAAEFAVGLVGLGHHRERIPAHQRGELFLDRQVAGKGRLVFHRDRVDVGRGEFGLPADALPACEPRELVEHLPRAPGPVHLREREEGLAPFRRLGRVGVVRERRIDALRAHLVGGNRGVHAGTLGRGAKHWLPVAAIPCRLRSIKFCQLSC